MVREYYPITSSLRELQRRYPWPHEKPNVPFDRRGWCQAEQRGSILELLPVRPQLILEIGSFMGASLRFMMEASPGSFFIAIDPLTGSFGFETDRRIRAPLKDFLTSNCWPYRDRLVIIQKNSAEALPELLGLQIAPDMAYIDGFHDYAHVKEDIDGCLSLNPRMILFGDDYHAEPYDGLRRAVKESAEKFQRRFVCLHNYLWQLADTSSSEPRPSRSVGRLHDARTR